MNNRLPQQREIPACAQGDEHGAGRAAAGTQCPVLPGAVAARPALSEAPGKEESKHKAGASACLPVALAKQVENSHCSGVLAKRACGTGRIKMSDRTWLGSQGPLWTLAQGQLLWVPQASVGPQPSLNREHVADQQRTSSQHIHLSYSGEVRRPALLPASQRAQEAPQRGPGPSSHSPW